jgi:hypothetical protein
MDTSGGRYDARYALSLPTALDCGAAESALFSNPIAVSSNGPRGSRVLIGVPC